MQNQTTSSTATTLTKLLFCLLVASATGYAAAAHASLGGDISSVEADRLQMHAVIVSQTAQPVVAPSQTSLPTAAARQAVMPAGGYTVHEIMLPSGTAVRQYVSAAGVVFAVSWSGPFIPDLGQLLGPHFAALLALQKSDNRHGRRSVDLHTSDLVIESAGHPRDFAGRAYLPGALPSGVAENDIH